MMCCCLRLSVARPLLILVITLLSPNVQGQWISSQELLKLVDEVDSGAASFEPNSTIGIRYFPRNHDIPGLVGDRCSNEEPCQEGLECIKVLPLVSRCVPPINCLVRAAREFNLTFDWSEWAGGILEQAQLSNDDLFDAASYATSFDDFQSHSAVVRFVNAFQTSPRPSAVQRLQNAANECIPAVMARAPTTGGTIAYMGLHIEVGIVAKIAMSVYGSLGDNPNPNSWIRGTFGVEAGAGVELSWLIGFALTGTSADMAGGAIMVDGDIGAGFVGGVAILAHLNGLVSLEFTTGPALGLGFGVGYSIACALDDPTVQTTPLPTPGPTTPLPTPEPTTPLPTTPSPTPSPTAPQPTPLPTPAPTTLLTLQPTVRVFTSDPSVEAIYNAITSQPGVQVVFNGDNDGICTGVTGCTTSSNPICNGRGSGTTTDSSVYPVISSSTFSIGSTSGSGCCTCPSCTATLLETNAFTAPAGKNVGVQYTATAGSDWYECLLVLYEGSPPATISTNVVSAKLIRGSSIAALKTETFTTTNAGSHFLAFWAGSYDRSCGGALGARLTLYAFFT